jgi:5-oxoprolinase (ATP-hydrolysing)
MVGDPSVAGGPVAATAGHASKWQFWIDRGGTFTDIVAKRPDGQIVTSKLLSEDPEHYKDSAVEGIRRLLGLDRDEEITALRVDNVKMGTTVATNALLERKGENTVLFITRGFADALRIGYQNRPRLFDLNIVLPDLLYSRVVEVDERLAADGSVIQALDLATAMGELQRAYDAGYRSVAVVLMHGYRYAQHERLLAQAAREIGFPQVSVSHEVSNLMKLVPRGDTTVVDAYLSPILRRYVDQVASRMTDVRLMFMQSSGGLTQADRFHGKDATLSGPAGGIVGMVRTAAQAGFTKVIGFDMGGTSTDVSHYAGEFEREFETLVAGVRMRAPMMSIHTVAAGGGSILHFDGSRYRVGPDSAGANPGPASYRRGGPLTVTDCNVLLGKIQPDLFPKVFGPSGTEALDANVVREKFGKLAQKIGEVTGCAPSPEAVAEGFLEIAVSNMASAIKRISVARGHDVTEYVLNTFGGAGGQHACLVADALGMTQVFLHPLAGVLSAYGIGLADFTAIKDKTTELTLSEQAVNELASVMEELEAAAVAELLAQDLPKAAIEVMRKVHLRYEGTDTVLPVQFGPLPSMVRQFEETYKQRFSFLMPGRALIAASVAVEAIGSTGADATETVSSMTREKPLHSVQTVSMYSGGARHEAAVYQREDLRPGDRVVGPAIVAEKNSTTVIEPGWVAEITRLNHMTLSRVEVRPARHAIGTNADPVMLEIFNNLFMSIAEQMGLRLQQTAYSVNIKERLDFSCALFDGEGDLIANAPHIPVHLGSMGESIKTVLRENAGKMKPGDVYLINDPYHGGTHLPDITVITPVFDDSRRDPVFYVGSRGHHADIGGITPGSMPPASTSVLEEGILFDNWKLVEAGHFREEGTLEKLSSGPHPARNPRMNLADLRAQVAANEKGVQELRKVVGNFGLDVVQAYTRHVKDNAEEAVRRVITALEDGEFTLETDNGSCIRVSIRVDRANRCATIDFAGTSAQMPNNFNAPSSICMAAVLYVFRTLVNDDIPLNAGCLKPLNVLIPEGSMLNPVFPAAVVAGNVETSQCITNALYGALGVMAASQCTMNSLSFGNERYQYMETIAGGTGAGPTFDGTGVVHSNMTNSRITDPEVLEFRYPVVLECYRIRSGSGGAGEYRGGDGAERRIRFLEPMTVSILSNNRKIAPFGMSGGRPGGLGHNWIQRSSGRIQHLQGCESAEIGAGDTMVVETPGGGGFGSAG